MPIHMTGAAHGTKRCPDPSCRGHAPREMSVELHTATWTQRVGNGPNTIARVDKEPIEVPERHRICEHCGAENEIGALRTTENGIARLDWPTPSADTVAREPADEILPDPTMPVTLEERVADLERQVSWLTSRANGGRLLA